MPKFPLVLNADLTEVPLAPTHPVGHWCANWDTLFLWASGWGILGNIVPKKSNFSFPSSLCKHFSCDSLVTSSGRKTEDMGCMYQTQQNQFLHMQDDSDRDRFISTAVTMECGIGAFCLHPQLPTVGHAGCLFWELKSQYLKSKNFYVCIHLDQSQDAHKITFFAFCTG